MRAENFPDLRSEQFPLESTKLFKAVVFENKKIVKIISFLFRSAREPDSVYISEKLRKRLDGKRALKAVTDPC